MSSPSGTAAVILAAGASRRLGRPKQELELDGETLLERAVRTAFEAELSPVIVVVAASSALTMELQKRNCLIALNDQAKEGMASSIRCGVSAAQTSQAAGLMLMTCDQILLRAEHLRALCAHPDRITGSAYAGKVGIPAYFPGASFSALLQLQGDTGARELLRAAASVVDEELALDIDTPEDFDRILATHHSSL